MTDPKSEIAAALMRQFQLDHDKADGLALSLIQLSEEAWPVFHYAKDRDSLEELERAVKTIARILKEDLSEIAVGALNEHLIFGDSIDAIARRNADSDEEAMLSTVLHLHQLKSPDPKRLAISAVADDASDIIAAIHRTKLEVLGPAARGKKGQLPNLRGIQAVEAARNVWELAGKRPAPTRELTPGSPFEVFLSMVFNVLEVPGSAASSFKAWVRETATHPTRA